MRVFQATSVLLAAALLGTACGDAWADEGRVVGVRAVAVAPPPAGRAASAVDDPAPDAPVPDAPAPDAPAPDARAAVDVAAPGAAPAPRPLAQAAASSGVTISGFAFRPSAITAQVGDTISWTNADAAPHTATADDGSFDTGTLDRDGSGAHTFTRAGTFAYHCTIHPSMRGTVTVLSSAAAAPAPGPAPAASAPAASAPTLPDTGMDALGLALSGLAVLLAGLALRRLAAR
jgi:plastocyanin